MKTGTKDYFTLFLSQTNGGNLLTGGCGYLT